MNRADQYLKQALAIGAWLHAQGDEEAAGIADDLADRLQARHEAGADDDQTSPEWANGAGEVIDTEPAIRCWPAPGVVILSPTGPVLTIDPEDGGDVSVVHLGDVLDWRRAYVEQARHKAAIAAALDRPDRVLIVEVDPT